MRSWVVAMVLAGCAHVATPAAQEQWADEPAPGSPTERVPEAVPRVGPVVGAWLGVSGSGAGPDAGGRLGVRVRLLRNFALSAFGDLQVATLANDTCPEKPPPRVFSSCEAVPLLMPVLTGVLRAEFVTDGNLGRAFLPRLTFGLFGGLGAAFAPVGALSEPAPALPVYRFGLHFGFTRLPSGWWFPAFVDVGLMGQWGHSPLFYFAAGVGF